MKKILFSVAVVMAFAATTFAQFNSKVHFEQGGDTLTLESGGLIDMKAGSTITIAGAATINVSDSPTFKDMSVTYGVAAETGVFSGAVSALGLTATGTGASSLDIGGGLNAGTGNVALVDTTGKITALSATELANLSGAALTGLAPANIAAGTLIVGVKPYQHADCETLTPAAVGEFCFSTGTHILNISTAATVGGFAPLN